jgi:hypothetical protein
MLEQFSSEFDLVVSRCLAGCSQMDYESHCRDSRCDDSQTLLKWPRRVHGRLLTISRNPGENQAVELCTMETNLRTTSQQVNQRISEIVGKME